MTDKKATPATQKPTSQKPAQPKANNQTSFIGKLANKLIKQELADSATALNQTTDELYQEALAANPALQSGDKSKRDLLTDVGKKADTHATQNARLSGLTDDELKALKLFNPAMTILVLLSQSRENKKYLATFACMIAQKRSAAYIDLSKINAAAKDVSPTIETVSKGHRSCDVLAQLLIKMKRNNQKTLTSRAFKEAANHNGYTQADYVLRMLDKHQIGRRSKDGDLWKIEIQMDHPFITALIESQQ